ncbi:SDR family oxidoreductase [Pimelobacter simplex]|nr:SDR family oxidoreductase [Pimelobacter simplex]UUW92454.1 SDR family oxidoreductase [Pimelobacter simplex]UUW96282.1 SDR family oxidoreductase [Pimelobacter simplex]
MSRVVLVTGGGTGIGAAVARLLTAGGDQVVVCGRREEPLRDVAAGTGARAVVADVSEPAGIARVVDETIAAHGRLDGLVLNHGIIHVGRVDEVTPEQWEETLRVNLTSPFLLVRAALPHLLAARGAVVAVSSVAALRAADGMAAYSASKAGLQMLVQSLAVDHGRDGLRANAVCPGWTATEMGDAEMAELGAARGLSVADAYRLAHGGRAAAAGGPARGGRGGRRLAAVGGGVVRERGGAARRRRLVRRRSRHARARPAGHRRPDGRLSPHQQPRAGLSRPRARRRGS